MKTLFQIKQLNCSYDSRKVVLRVEELQIPQNRIVFFVGPSGVGKSTILETLGLMNNTILHAEEMSYNNLNLQDAWRWSDKKISEFRNNEFSFIFQQNNLMPNFTAQENILTAALFQGEDERCARQRMTKLLKALDLPSEDRPINQYSGGQQQRISFARAILPKFNVVFGDEPTGNLDHNTADKLMQMLTSAIRERQSTAIIVSHDIDLAVKYADEIIMIQKVKDSKYGEYGQIDKNSIYKRLELEKWKYEDNSYSASDLSNILKQHLV